MRLSQCKNYFLHNEINIKLFNSNVLTMIWQVIISCMIIVPITVSSFPNISNPFLYANILSIILSFIIFILMFIIYKNILIPKSLLHTLIPLIFITILNGILFYKSLNSFFTAIFWFSYLLYFLIIFNIKLRTNINIGLEVSFTLLILLNIAFFFKSDFERFIGFSQSASTYSLMLSCLTILILYSSKNLFIILLLPLTLYFIYLSGTRTSMFIMIAAVTSIFCFWKSKNLKRLFWPAALLIICIYPILDFLFINHDIFLNIFKRETDIVENSITTRLIFNKIQINELFKLNILDIFVGKGFNALRDILNDYIVDDGSVDIQPHNDFIRALYDFGIVYIYLILRMLRKYYTDNAGVFFILIGYLLSFYHNMMYYMPFNILIIMSISSVSFKNDNVYILK